MYHCLWRVGYRACRVGPRRLAESEAKPMRADKPALAGVLTSVGEAEACSYGSTGRLVPRISPELSLARTATYGSLVCASMAVSKPSRGTAPRGSSRFGRGPVSTSHAVTSVEPFQLA